MKVPLLTQKLSVITEQDESHNLFVNFVNELDDEQMKFEMKKMYIPNDDIEHSGTRLGKGQSGQAFLAKYKNRQVCVKMCIPTAPDTQGPPYKKYQAADKVNENVFKDIFKEAYKMRQFEHQNVMKVRVRKWAPENIEWVFTTSAKQDCSYM